MREEKNIVQDSDAQNLYFCGHCKISLISLQDLKDHLGTSHSKESTTSESRNANIKFKCKVCHLELASKDNLRKHQKFVHDLTCCLREPQEMSGIKN